MTLPLCTLVSSEYVINADLVFLSWSSSFSVIVGILSDFAFLKCERSGI